MSLTNQQLEQIVLTVRARQDAMGVLMLICDRNERAEIVAALHEEISDLPAVLRRMADEIESGSGHKIGSDGTHHPE